MSMTILENYQSDPMLRDSFFQFVQTVFTGLDFKSWYEKGFWSDAYIPYSIVTNNQIVSNVSVCKMTLLIDGREVPGIQFATVGTLSEYRNKGFSRILMEYVLEKYHETFPFMFLFANEGVIDFYPRFGFRRLTEVVFIQHVEAISPACSNRKLDIHSAEDMVIIQKLLHRRAPLTRLFGAVNYDFITFWHILNIFPEYLFYLEEENSLIIASEGEGQLHIWEVISEVLPDLSKMIPRIITNEKVHSIVYYFPPDYLYFQYDTIREVDDSPLFVRGEFPLEGRHFKFPVTAQT